MLRVGDAPLPPGCLIYHHVASSISRLFLVCLSFASYQDLAPSMLSTKASARARAFNKALADEARSRLAEFQVGTPPLEMNAASLTLCGGRATYCACPLSSSRHLLDPLLSL